MHSLTFKKHLHSECSTASVGGCEVNKAIVVKVLRCCREREREGLWGSITVRTKKTATTTTANESKAATIREDWHPKHTTHTTHTTTHDTHTALTAAAMPRGCCAVAMDVRVKSPCPPLLTYTTTSFASRRVTAMSSPPARLKFATATSKAPVAALSMVVVVNTVVPSSSLVYATDTLFPLAPVTTMSSKPARSRFAMAMPCAPVNTACMHACLAGGKGGGVERR